MKQNTNEDETGATQTARQTGTRTGIEVKQGNVLRKIGFVTIAYSAASGCAG